MMMSLTSSDPKKIHLIDPQDLESVVLVSKDKDIEMTDITVHYLTEWSEEAGDDEVFVKVELTDEDKEFEAEMAEWTTKFINSLPDSSFAVVEPCAKEKKNARHLPYKDASGKIDLAHLKNALARMNQIKSVCGGSDEALRAKAKSKLVPLAKKYFPDSTFAKEKKLSDEDIENGDSSNSKGDNMTDEAELSKRFEDVTTKSETEKLKKELSEQTAELKKEIDALKTVRIRQLAESVVVKEITLGSVKEENKSARIDELMKGGENMINTLVAAYASIPEKTEEKAGKPNPKATGLAEKAEKLSDEEEKVAELRQRWFYHRKPRAIVMPIGKPSESELKQRYIELSNVEQLEKTGE